ncbi:MAG: hypothetical protein ACYSU6_08655 [Planctomycetota bacterium]
MVFSVALVNELNPAVTMRKKKRQLVLNKGAEKFIFRYDSGHEDELLDALIDQAKDRRTDFDWFDAAVLSFKLTQSLIGQADEFLHKDTDAQVHAN